MRSRPFISVENFASFQRKESHESKSDSISEFEKDRESGTKYPKMRNSFWSDEKKDTKKEENKNSEVEIEKWKK